MPSAPNFLSSLKLNNVSIRVKIWAGFGLILIILAVVSLTSAVSLSKTSKSVTSVVKDILPLVLASNELTSTLNESSGDLGYYMLTKEKVYWDSYETGINKVNVVINRLTALLDNNDVETGKVIQLIKTDIKRFVSYKETMLELSNNTLKNDLGMAYTTQHLNPLAKEVLQKLSEAWISEEEEVSTAKRKQLFILLADLRYTWVNVMSGVRRLLSFRNKASIDEYHLHYDLTGTLLKKLYKYEDIFTFEQADALERIKEIYELYADHFSKFSEIQMSDQYRADINLVKSEVGEVLSRIKSNLSILVNQQKELINSESSSLLFFVEASKVFVYTMFFIGLIIGLALASAVNFMITRPISDAVSALKDISEGEGDLTRRLNVNGTDEVGQLALAFNSFISKIQGLIREVTSSTTQLSAAAEEMSMITGETRSGVQRQQSETTLVATAINEMNSTVQEVAQNAQSAAVATSEADNQAEQGKQVMISTKLSINSLATEVEKAASVINELEKDSDSIGSVLIVIQGIAEQTNLLALNAAIEAARAGEQGRGFAVVADEVRSLASRTHESTQEIQDMIERLQNGSRSAVSAMQTGQEQAQHTVEQASQAEKALSEISGAVAKINEMNAHIAEASRQQGEVVEEINQNIVNITQVADESANGADQLSTASQEMANLAVELESQITHFKI